MLSGAELSMISFLEIGAWHLRALANVLGAHATPFCSDDGVLMLSAMSLDAV
jgi:hypothetical protein